MILLPWLIALLGVLLYALAGNPKVQELGRLAFACGLLVALWRMAGAVVRFGAG